MTPGRLREVEALFHGVLEGNEAALDACADDDIRDATRELVASYRRWSTAVAAPPQEAEAHPRFGPYQCDSRIGSGGMGTVYRAHRDDGEFARAVAIKVLRGSLQSEWHFQRFRDERQILARLDHPNIVHLFDGGVTPDGEPYVVMELVDGRAIDRYCDERRLSIDARLALMHQVLDAVAYAHRSLVVHRDLKPSNILVTEEGVVKLLDFGTSKFIDDDATITSLRALTPRYASPELLRGEIAGVSSDVFSAGVLLYELVVGASPFNTSNDLADALRRATEETRPKAPAPAVTDEAAKARSSSVKTLTRVVQGDLARILEKGLASDVARRYESIAALRDDLQRYRGGLPIEARAPTLVYRVRKFARRHRIGVAAVVALLAVAVAGAIATRQQAVLAEHRFEDVRSLATFLIGDVSSGLQQLPGSTQLQRTSVERSLSYLDRLIADAGADASLRLSAAEGYLQLGDVLGNPFRANLGERAKARDAYQKGLAALEPLPSASPSVARLVAQLHLQRGGTRSFGSGMADGLVEVREAVAQLKAQLASSPQDDGLRLLVARGVDFLGTRVTAGGGNIEGAHASEAEALFKEALDEASSVVATAPGHVDALRQLAMTENDWALLYGSERPVEALAHHRRAVAYLDRLPAAAAMTFDVRRLRANILMNVGWAEGQAGAQADAIAHLEQARDVLQAWSILDPSNTNIRYQLTSVYRAIGIVEGYRHNAPRAIAAFRWAADTHRQLGEIDPQNKTYRFLRGENLVRAGNWLASSGASAEASRTASEGLAILEELAQANDASLTHVFGACRWLAEVEVVALRAPDKAFSYCERAKDLTDGKDPDAFAGMANAEFQRGHRDAAIENLERAIAMLPPTVSGAAPTQQRRDLERELARYTSAPISPRDTRPR